MECEEESFDTNMPFSDPYATIAATNRGQPATRGAFRSRGRGYRGRGNAMSTERTSKCYLCRGPHLLARCVYRPETVPPGTCVACGGAYHKAYHHKRIPPTGWPLNPQITCHRCRRAGHTKVQCPNQYAGTPSPATQAYLQEFEAQTSWEPED